MEATSLFISNFEKGLSMFGGILEKLQFGYVVYIGSVGLLLLSGWIVSYKSRHSYRSAAYIVLTILSLRFVLFDNPLSWEFYIRNLRQDEIGWRQHAVIIQEHSKYFKKPLQVKFLTVGSSQTASVFGRYALEHEDTNLFSLAGLQPLELMLYKERITDYHPQHILLYLSEFDMARSHKGTSITTSPPQRFFLVKLYLKLRTLPQWEHYQRALTELWVGEIFPEYKYAFIFRGLFTGMLGPFKKYAVAPPIDLVAPAPQDDIFRRQEFFRKNLHEVNIEFNMSFLNDFIEYGLSRNIHFIIVEGQYNPNFYTESNQRLNSLVRRELQGLADKFATVTFIPRETIFEFTASQYKDSVHIKPEAGYQYSKLLFERLREINRQN